MNAQHERKVVHGMHACEAAAKYGHLQILQWARREGCPWDARTCEAAAEAVYFLKYCNGHRTMDVR